MDERRKAQLKINRQNSKQRAKEFVATYFASYPCVDCGESDSIVLTFDHVRGEKRANVSDMVQAGLGLQTITDEISKCDVVCFNCHAIRSQKRSGMYRWQRINRRG